MYDNVRRVNPVMGAVTAEIARDHLRVDGADEDSLINGYVLSATTEVENEIGSPICEQPLDIFYDQFASEIILPLGPLQSITTVKYTDAAGTQQTLDAAEYEVDLVRSRLRAVNSWPGAKDAYNAVEIRVSAGFLADSIPEPLKQAVLLLVGHKMENREAVSVENTRILPLGVRHLIDPYRWNRFG